jgi:hypothetical protein
MPRGTGIVYGSSANEAKATHLPDRHVSIVIAPENVRFSIPVEISDPGDMPGIPGIRQRARSNDGQPIHQPNRDATIVITPKDV